MEKEGKCFPAVISILSNKSQGDAHQINQIKWLFSPNSSSILPEDHTSHPSSIRKLLFDDANTKEKYAMRQSNDDDVDGKRLTL